MSRLAFVALFLVACSDDGGSFASFQACFDASSQSTRAAIVTCCNAQIGGASDVCGSTATTCASYVTSNLEQTSATQTEIIEACNDYEMQRM